MQDSLNPQDTSEWRTRLRMLADLLFASAMTIMILNLKLPSFGHITDTKALGVFLIDQLSGMGVYLVAFVVVSVYWIKHLEHFNVTVKVDQTYIWLQLMFLGFILLIPFWNTYITLFPENIAIKVFLSLNMIIVGLFSYASLAYAAHPKHRLLLPEVSTSALKTAKSQILTEPIIAALAAGSAFIDPQYWDWTFILIPVLFMFRKKLTSIPYFKVFKKSDS